MDMMVRAGREIRASRPALTTGTMLEAWHVMAAHQSTSRFPLDHAPLPDPDPFPSDPLGWTRCVYRWVAGFPGYFIGSDGSFWSCKTLGSGTCIDLGKPHRVATHPNDKGYIQARLSRSPKLHARLVHRLVLEAFIGPRPPGMECRHLDGDKANNDIRNLRWGTPLENAADQIRHGSQVRGERSSKAKLTGAQVVEIRILRAAGMSLPALARKFGVRNPTILKIVRREYWAHIP